jgi:hypothetical protein
MASGANNTFRQVGIATGIAVLGAVFQSQIVSHTTAALSRSDVGQEVLRREGARLGAALASGQVRSMQVPAHRVLLDAYTTAFSTTLNHLMYIGAAVAFVGVVGAFALVRQRDFVVPTAHVSAPQGAQPGPGAPAPEGTPAAVGGGGAA